MPSPNWSRAALPESWQKGGFGLYIHWPFCAAKCPYCDFNSHVRGEVDQSRWTRAYSSEIRRLAADTPGRVLSSVFFGGGTPSLMQADTVAGILDAVRDNWTVANDIEITLEANPTSVEADRFRGYREAGVNRLSLGVQALNDRDLRALGRMHSVAEALQALEIARSTFERVSFDLIYARQHQSAEDWTAELQQALGFDPGHLSLYQLTIEDGTAFGDRFKRGRLPGLPDGDLGADMYELTQELCIAAGLPAYEVSNHAKPGQESRHNLIYWQGGDYAGVGPGAHGRLGANGQRWATDAIREPASWLEQVETKPGSAERRQALSHDDQDIERLMMGLRIAEGLPLSDLHAPARFEDSIGELSGYGLVEQCDGQLIVTPDGRPLLNAILRELLG